MLFAGVLLTSSWAKAESYSNAKTQYVDAAGLRVAYRVFGSAQGVPLVLLMHTRGNMDNWDPKLLDVLAMDRKVIAFDGRGVGLTNGETPNSFEAMADDAALFIKALGLSKVDLLGFSIGGAVAQELLIRHNDLIRKAIIAGSSAKGGVGVNDLSEKSKSVSTKKEFTDEDILYAFFAPSESSQKLGREFLSRLKKRTSDRDKPVSMQAVAAQAVARKEWGAPLKVPDERMAAIKNPILVANGKDDIRMPTINSYNLFKLAPKAQLILYPDSGHGFLFQYPELCGENFTEFLNQSVF
ncbi:alpha/beta fold hydrolase [Bdellovibrio sp. HCB288]|uniref:alpha/beta fold hydrolase n=1 Tax=Bdellovibrio sp. HCB288 TaxID=3394355 RepID=UPI0039B5A719